MCIGPTGRGLPEPRTTVWGGGGGGGGSGRTLGWTRVKQRQQSPALYRPSLGEAEQLIKTFESKFIPDAAERRRILGLETPILKNPDPVALDAGLGSNFPAGHWTAPPPPERGVGVQREMLRCSSLKPPPNTGREVLLSPVLTPNNIKGDDADAADSAVLDPRVLGPCWRSADDPVV